MSEIRVKSTGTIKLFDSDDSHYVGLQSGGTVSSNVDFTLPTADGSNGQFLKTNGSGALSFDTVSGTTINNNADNKVITGSGTANTLEGEANLVFDGSRLGVNNSSMSSYDANGQDLVVGSNSGSNGITVACGSSGSSNIMFSTGTTGDQIHKGRIKYNESDNTMAFFADGDSEQMRIQSSRVGIGTASPDDVRLHVKTPNQACIQTERTGTGNSGHMSFKNPNGQVGEIVTNGSATSFLTSSDYRLKENIDYNFDATTRLKQLKPARFNFKANTDTTVDGFIAHEVSSIVPEAISGTKDATETRQKVVLDFNGNFIARNIEQTDWTKGKADEIYPSNSTWEASKVYAVHQGIDQSKLVPLLVKTVLELEARITTLENA